MVSTEGIVPSAPVFAPSPPLSVSDCEHQCSPRGGDRPRRRSRLRPRQKPESSPCSTASSLSNQAPARSAVTSFTSDYKEEGDGVRDKELARACSLVRGAWEGSLPSGSEDQLEYTVLHITPSQYQELRRDLRRHSDLLSFFDNTLRSDYDPRRSVLVLRLMESAVHEFVKSGLVRRIWAELDRIIDGADAAVSDLASQISGGGNSRVTLDASDEEADSYKSPDSQLCFLGAPSPPFVIEVAYSQNTEDLEEDAKNYYEDSGGEIKTVLNIKVEYLSPDQRKEIATGGPEASVDRSAYFSLYRGPDRVDEHILFRNSQGDMVDGGPLRLLLSDFIPDDVLETQSAEVQNRVRTTTIDVGHEHMYRALRAGERHQELVDAKNKEREEERERQRKAGLPSKKRKSVRVHWQVRSGDNVDFHGLVDEDNQEADASGAPSSSKRRRTRSLTQEDSAFRGRLPARTSDRETRSSSRQAQSGAPDRST